MKLRSYLVLLALAVCAPLHAAIVYSGLQNIPIPFDFEGVYIRIDTGATSFVEPPNFTAAPWVNPFFGGAGIGNSPLFRPIITGTDQILNLAPGTVIGPGGNFVAGQSGSSTHLGGGSGQFLPDVPGYVGAIFRSSMGDPDHYGWIFVELDNNSAGRIISWAYESVNGTPIRAGAISIPEPCTALFGFALALVALGQRARTRVY